jgi:hypothetical protein
MQDCRKPWLKKGFFCRFSEVKERMRTDHAIIRQTFSGVYLLLLQGLLFF